MLPQLPGPFALFSIAMLSPFPGYLYLERSYQEVIVLSIVVHTSTTISKKGTVRFRAQMPTAMIGVSWNNSHLVLRVSSSRSYQSLSIPASVKILPFLMKMVSTKRIPRCPCVHHPLFKRVKFIPLKISFRVQRDHYVCLSCINKIAFCPHLSTRLATVICFSISIGLKLKVRLKETLHFTTPSKYEVNNDSSDLTALTLALALALESAQLENLLDVSS